MQEGSVLKAPYTAMPTECGVCAGAYDCVFGGAYLSQGPTEGAPVSCTVLEVIDLTDGRPGEQHLNAACACCAMVARVVPGRAADCHVQDVLRGVLQAFTGSAPNPEEVRQMYEQRVKPAAGGRRSEGGPSQPHDASASGEGVAELAPAALVLPLWGVHRRCKRWQGFRRPCRNRRRLVGTHCLLWLS